MDILQVFKSHSKNNLCILVTTWLKCQPMASVHFFCQICLERIYPPNNDLWYLHRRFLLSTLIVIHWVCGELGRRRFRPEIHMPSVENEGSSRRGLSADHTYFGKGIKKVASNSILECSPSEFHQISDAFSLNALFVTVILRKHRIIFIGLVLQSFHLTIHRDVRIRRTFAVYIQYIVLSLILYSFFIFLIHNDSEILCLWG